MPGAMEAASIRIPAEEPDVTGLARLADGTSLRVGERTRRRVARPTPAEVLTGPGTPLRPRWRRVGSLVLVAAILALPLTVRDRASGELAAFGNDAAEAADADDEVAAEGADVAAPPPAAAVDTLTAFARFDDVAFVAPDDAVRLIGFHEASFADALAITPSGQLRANDNTTKFTPPADVEGFGYYVLSSRGRPNPATSAVDVAMEEGVAVTSPVSGTVASVTGYHLYGRYADTRVEIVPDGRPDLRVVIIHVRDVAVTPGQHVDAGGTVLAASANRFPFASHIDRYVPGTPGPHIHVEVKATGPAD